MPDTDLVYLPEGTNDFVDYVEATGWAQDFTRTIAELSSFNASAGNSSV